MSYFPDHTHFRDRPQGLGSRGQVRRPHGQRRQERRVLQAGPSHQGPPGKGQGGQENHTGDQKQVYIHSHNLSLVFFLSSSQVQMHFMMQIVLLYIFDMVLF